MGLLIFICWPCSINIKNGNWFIPLSKINNNLISHLMFINVMFVLLIKCIVKPITVKKRTTWWKVGVRWPTADMRPRSADTKRLFYCRLAVSPFNTTLTGEKVQITNEFRKEGIVFDLDLFKFMFLDHQLPLLSVDVLFL